MYVINIAMVLLDFLVSLHFIKWQIVLPSQVEESKWTMEESAHSFKWNLKEPAHSLEGRNTRELEQRVDSFDGSVWTLDRIVIAFH